jgi:hypothetical protein
MQEYHFKKLPVWIDGNAYLNGAVAWKNEKNKFVDDKEKAYVELVEDNGKYSIKTNVYDILGSFTDGIINSDILGEAFEPEQRFENPDGSSIIFNRDYSGGHRGNQTIPGPFATKEAAGKQLW